MSGVPQPSPDDLTLGMLVALLMQLGGSCDLPADAFATDALGTQDGHLHAVELTPLDNGQLRLLVVPRPAGFTGGVHISDAEEGERRAGAGLAALTAVAAAPASGAAGIRCTWTPSSRAGASCPWASCNR